MNDNFMSLRGISSVRFQTVSEVKGGNGIKKSIRVINGENINEFLLHLSSD
jgi:hypothetical protein